MAHYPLMARKRVLAAKVESTQGTAEALTVAEAAHNVFEATIEPLTEMEMREMQGGFGQLPAVPGARFGKVTFYTEMYGGSAAPSWASVFLPAVGLGIDTGTYTLDILPPEAAASTQETLTIGMYQDGIFKSIYGAMGNAKFTFEAGKKARVDFEFTGIWGTPSDVALVAPTYPTSSPLRFVSSAFTIGAWTPTCNMVEIDLQNKVYLRQDSTTASGFASAVISNRQPKLTLDPEADILATKNVWSEWLASTEADLSMMVAAGSDDCTIEASDVQWIKPTDGNREDIMTTQIEAQLNADDLTLTFT